MTSHPTIPREILSPEFFRKYDVRGPRYTSYPTVPFWSEEFDGEAWRSHLREKGRSAAEGALKPLSLYVHIPFCRTHCLFCACNVIITRQEGIAGRYLDSVEQEVGLVAAEASASRQVIQLHLGGGTPNYLSGEEMARLMRILRSAFAVHEDAEISLEADPRTCSREEVRRLREQDGFNRISFGVQDFHEATQLAIGRSQTYEITLELVDEARRAGFRSVNVDLIYGLPEQSRESWRETIDRFLALRPSRLALYNFAFLPGRLAHQRKLQSEDLPDPGEKLVMFLETNERLLDAGYRFIGMDHYALEDDDLTRALDDGTLHRNFMGYTTLRGTDMLAFGTSSISDFAGGFAQNTKKLSEYEREVAEGHLPVECGMILSDEDELRRWTIESLMCSGRLRKKEFAQLFHREFDRHFAKELRRLEPLASDGLIELGADELYVTPAGRFFLRNLAMPFDAYLPESSAPLFNEKGKPLFSRTL